MKSDKAILDTSVLISLYQLNLLENLILFFNNVRVPRKVEEEFLLKNKDEIERSKRHRFLEEFYSKNGVWFTRCNEYSEDIIAIYLADINIDEGEAEVFAQNQALGNDYLMLLDESNARNLARKNELACHGVLYILAKLDLNFKICNYFDNVKILKEIYRFRVNDKIVSHVYTTVQKDIT